MQLTVARELVPLSAPFTITGYTFTDMTIVVARVEDRGAAGQGEAAGVYYLDDGADRMCAALEDVRRDVEAGVDRASRRSPSN
jgi:L-alanine-DL-glutamate epimerase-like enolase superfamily enzyme